MEARAETVLIDSLVEALAQWITADNELCTIRRLDGVPDDIVEGLQESVRKRLDLIDERRSELKLPRYNTHVERLVKRSDLNNVPGQVSADRATEIRNEVGEVFSLRDEDSSLDGLGLLLITTPISGDFSSVGPGTLKSIRYDEALRLAAKHIIENFDLSEYSSILTETLSYKWANGNNESSESSEGHAHLFAVVAARAPIGPELWRIGLIPDLGEDDLGVRIQANRRVVKVLSAPVARRDTLTRLMSAGVKLTSVTRQVGGFLGSRDLSYPTKWCQELLFEKDGELTFEKWQLDDVVASYIDDLSIFPFRDANGTVISSSRLSQDGEKTHSDPIYAVMKFNLDGEPTKAPSVVVEWETDPLKVASIAQWTVSLVIPEAYREIDQEPLIIKNVKGDKRKISFKIDINREDLPEGVGEAGLLVCLEVAAFEEDGAPVRFRNSGEDVSKESQEFEIRFAEVDIEPTSKTRGDNSISPSEAQLSVAVSADLPEHTESLLFRDYARVLDIEFVEVGEKARVLHSRSIRTVPNLMGIQSRMIADGSIPYAPYFSGRSGKQLSLDEVDFQPLDLPDALVTARQKFFEELKKACATRNRILVEVAIWSDSLSDCLDRYVEEFLKALSSGDIKLKTSLLRMETLELSLEDRSGVASSTVVLPTHPMRAAWIREYTRQLGKMVQSVSVFSVDERKSQVDMKLIRRVSASNFPFVLGQRNGDIVAYGEEVAFGYGFYVNPKDADYDVIMSMVLETLGADRAAALESVRVANLGRVVDKFLETKKNSDVLSLLTLNEGDGHLVAPVLGRFFQDETDDNDAKADYRLVVKCYADRFSFSNPVRKLNELQVARSGAIKSGLSHLAPPIGVSVRNRERLVEDTDNVHLAVALGITSGEVANRKLRYSRKAHMNGLVSGTQTEKNHETEEWFTTAHIGGKEKSFLSELHRSFLEFVDSAELESGEHLGVKVELSANTKFEIRSLHDRADRVVTIDRFVGLDWYEEAQSIGLGATYVLDYTPDFVEGMSDRLIVTTRYRDEMVRVVGSAMKEMGLDVIGSETAVINNLGLVSGRLALNLLSHNPQAHEAVGLAVTISYLKAEGQLDGWVVIPVDSHLEVFGADVQNRSENGRRCDMVLARFEEGCLRIRCIEVKERQGGNVSEKLLERIAEQLNNTVHILTDRFLRVDDSRVDRPVQVAHFSSILHHYIDKAHIQGLIDAEQWSAYHSGADNLDNGCYEISREGYVVALQGSIQETRNFDGIPIQVVTELDLVGTQFTSSAEALTRSVVEEENVALQPTYGDFDEEVVSPSSRRESEIQHDGSNVEESLEKSKNEQDSMMTTEDSEDVAEAEDDPQSVKSKSLGQMEVTEELSRPMPEVITNTVHPSKVVVELGRDLANQVVNWEVSTKGSPHAFILGITGQGKSVTTRHIVNSFAIQGLPSLILDLHGDMAANPPSNATVIDARKNGLGFSPFQLSGHLPADVNDSAFEIAEIVGYVCELGEIQTMHVYRGMNQAYKNLGWVDGEVGERLPTMTEFADAVEAVEAGAKGKNARERLMPFTDFGLFRSEDDQAFDPTGGGNGLVIDLHGYKNEKVLRAASSFILRKIYREMFLWPQDATMKIAIVIDEAHRFAKDKTLPKLMKEGRKYGVSCLVASQSISDFDKEVSGNAGTKIVFRTNFPESKKVAEMIRGAGKNDLSKMVEQLNVGEAYVGTPDQPVARKTRMTGDV
jgi:DNA phosphorothioation-dependent restriction protein DptH